MQLLTVAVNLVTNIVPTSSLIFEFIKMRFNKR